MKCMFRGRGIAIVEDRKKYALHFGSILTFDIDGVSSW